MRRCTDDASCMISQKHHGGWIIPIKAPTHIDSNGNDSLAVSGSLRKLLDNFRAGSTGCNVVAMGPLPRADRSPGLAH